MNDMIFLDGLFTPQKSEAEKESPREFHRFFLNLKGYTFFSSGSVTSELNAFCPTTHKHQLCIFSSGNRCLDIRRPHREVCTYQVAHAHPPFPLLHDEHDSLQTFHERTKHLFQVKRAAFSNSRVKIAEKPKMKMSCKSTSPRIPRFTMT